MIRTPEAGSLRATDAGTRPSRWPGGWPGRSAITRGVTFLDLRDASGFVPGRHPRRRPRSDLRNESPLALKAVGEVRKRPGGGETEPGRPGEIKVVIAHRVEVLSASAPLPFPIDEHKSSNLVRSC